jgi:hypothetical protein
MSEHFLLWLSDTAYTLHVWLDQLAYRIAPRSQLPADQREKLIKSISVHIQEHILLADELETTEAHAKAHQEAAQ